MACATWAGQLVGRFGADRVLGSGLALMALGMALFARIQVNGSYLSDVLVPGVLAATGIGFSVVPSTIAATATAPPSEAGLASGLVNTSRQMGGALGLAILTSVAALYTSHLTHASLRAPILALTDGFRLAFALGAGFAALAALAAFRLIPPMVRTQQAPSISPTAPPAPSPHPAALAPAVASRTHPVAPQTHPVAPQTHPVAPRRSS
jgi:MFS family permease